REVSASEPNLNPLIQSRLRIISGLGVIASVLATIVVYLTGSVEYPINSVRMLGFHGVGILLNLGLFLFLSRKNLAWGSLFVLHTLTFVGNSVVFVTLPTLEIGLRGDLYNAAAILVLLRSIFVPCIWQVSLVFGLVVWSFYPLTVLIGAHYVPQLAADL